MSTGSSSSSAPPPAAASSSSGPNWAEIPRMGQPVAGFLPLKTPRTTPPDDESMFDVSMFVERQQSLGRSVGLCINLCGGKAKAAETYDTAEWDQWDVAYKAIACADEAVPAEEAVDAFVAAVGSLWSDPLKRKLYVAVHCATGFNVTGYMICRYLMRVGAVERAVAAFAAARAPGIYDGELLAALADKSSATPKPTLDAPAPPAWHPAAGVKATAGKRKRAEAMPPPPPPKPAAAASSGAAASSSAEASKAVLDAAKAVLKPALEAGVLGEAAYERALRRTHEKTMAALASSKKPPDFAAVRALAAEYIKLASQQPK